MACIIRQSLKNKAPIRSSIKYIMVLMRYSVNPHPGHHITESYRYIFYYVYWPLGYLYILILGLLQIVMKRGQRGYGFSVTGSSPACVRRVDGGSAACQAGLRELDAVIRINGQNVSKSIADSVAKIVRQSEKQIVLDIVRSKVNCERDTSATAALLADEKKWRADFDRLSLLSTSSDDSSLERSNDTSHDLLVDLGDWKPPVLPRMHSSTPIRSHIEHTGETERQTAIQELTEFEQEFVDLMQFGIQRYSNPLRRQFVSPTEHVTLFQNAERLISLSEYHVYKLTGGTTGYSDVINSRDTPLDSIGAIYLPNVSTQFEHHTSLVMII